MKYIKELSEFDNDNKFNTDEVRELKDVYNEIVDDLDLYDNKNH